MRKFAVVISCISVCIAAITAAEIKEENSKSLRIPRPMELNLYNSTKVAKLNEIHDWMGKSILAEGLKKGSILRRRRRQLLRRFLPSRLGLLRRCSRPCPQWTSWQGMEACGATCGTGARILRRHCKNQTPTKRCRGMSVKWEVCNTNPCPVWAAWVTTTKCSEACGEEQQHRTRACMLGDEQTSGCAGKNQDTMSCPPKASCVSNWGEWTEFSTCSRSCGEEGTQQRTRICQVAPSNQLGICDGRAVEFRQCNEDVECPRLYSEWAVWDECDPRCGKWTELTRNRTCLNESCDKDALSEQRLCTPSNCSQNTEQGIRQTTGNYALQAWSSWSVCSGSCEMGVQMRSRKCESISPNQIVCDDEFSETRPCTILNACPKWAAWSQCEESCEKKPGICMRSRLCILTRRRASEKKSSTSENEKQRTTLTTLLDITVTLEELSYAMSTIFAPTAANKKLSMTTAPATSYVQEITSVDDCQGGLSASREIRKCETRACSSSWSRWSQWSKCSSTCGPGVRYASRTCNRTLNKANCTGSSTKYEECVAPPCWGQWSVFSACSVSCGSGSHSRWRECLGTTDSMPGYAKCNDTDLEISRCNTQECPPMWSSWSAYSECSKSCGGGTKNRKRTCLRGDCRGSDSQRRSCKNHGCPFWSQWTGFTCCSVTCGAGYKSRQRRCFLGEPGDDGCIGSATEDIECVLKSCDNITEENAIPDDCGVRYSIGNLRKSFLGRITANVQRVAGGNVSKQGAWPWQVSLQHYSVDSITSRGSWRHFCAGTLLSDKWVLSAAHCTMHTFPDLHHDNVSSKYTVLVGSIKRLGDKSSQRIRIKRIFVHDHYSYEVNDIELIMLRSDARLNKNVLPACLPYTQLPSSDDTCYVTGWGHTENSQNQTDILLEAEIPILEFNQCKKIYNSAAKFISSEYHMCAGANNSSVDTCRSDSGGPLVCVGNDKRWYIAGVTSWGLQECAKENKPGIYVPVSRYELWIRDIMTNKLREAC